MLFGIDLRSLSTSIDKIDLPSSQSQRPVDLFCVAMDIPIGLLDGPRACDIADPELLSHLVFIVVNWGVVAYVQFLLAVWFSWSRIEKPGIALGKRLTAHEPTICDNRRESMRASLIILAVAIITIAAVVFYVIWTKRKKVAARRLAEAAALREEAALRLAEVIAPQPPEVATPEETPQPPLSRMAS